MFFVCVCMCVCVFNMLWRGWPLRPLGIVGLQTQTYICLRTIARTLVLTFSEYGGLNHVTDFDLTLYIYK